MDLYEIFKILSPIILMIISGAATVVWYMMKKLAERIHKLEEKHCQVVTRADARTMIDDKVYPLRKQIDTMDRKLDKIINIMLSK